MDFNRFDMVLLVTMSFAIILMSFAFPQLGMTADSDAVGENEIPEYNTSNSTFDFSGGFPNMGVNSPTSGTMDYDGTRNGAGGIEGMDLYWIDRPKSEGTSIQLTNDSSEGLQIWYRDWDSTGTVTASDEYNVNEEGQQIIHNNDSWTIEMTVTSIQNRQEANMTAEVDFLVRNTPDGVGGGWNFDGLGDIAQVLTYLAVVITWGVTTIVEVSLNLVVTMFEISVFLVDLMHWLSTTYFSVVNAASGWASVILLVPGIILSLEFGKIGMVLLSLLPTT